MKNHKHIIITILISISIIVIAYAYSVDVKKDIQTEIQPINVDYTISNSWELPASLNEISGISWIDDQTIACVQDEDGIIFIYDLSKKAVIKEIEFADNGDYEGIAIHDNDAYVMRSDGLLFEISNYNTDKIAIKTYETGFSESNNMETLAWAHNSNTLITAPKDKDSHSDIYKGIYELSLTSKKAKTTASYKIDMNAKVFKGIKNKKTYKTFNPSDIAMHPITEELYVLEGKNPKLLIMDKKGTLKSLHTLNTSDFPQPEGITFDSNGQLYIASEAKGGSAFIHLLDLK